VPLIFHPLAFNFLYKWFTFWLFLVTFWITFCLAFNCLI
jgi:hypothetical protein